MDKNRLQALDDVRRRLVVLFVVPIAISLIIVLLYETELLPTGIWAEEHSVEFVVLSIMELITICLIPLSLRLFKFGRIHSQLTGENNVEALNRWGSIRILMLTIPMMVNTLLYYLFMHTAFGYMAIILLLSLLFVTPSKSRCYEETLSNHSQL